MKNLEIHLFFMYVNDIHGDIVDIKLVILFAKCFKVNESCNSNFQCFSVLI